jgi:O-antigen/teichoic acid export membrane protein
MATVVQDSDAALAFGTVALIVVSIVVLVVVFTLFRRIRDALVKWYYRRKYAAEFRRRDRP